MGTFSYPDFKIFFSYFLSFGVLQSDQYHYLHHRFFECNYGTSGTPWDKMFGTFRDKLKETGASTYRGGSEEKTDAKSAAIHDSKATLGLPEAGFTIYIGVNCMIWALV